MITSISELTGQCSPMKYRKRRIAWSVVWGLLAVLLCVLWVRSYLMSDGWLGDYGSSLVDLYHVAGEIHFHTNPQLTSNNPSVVIRPRPPLPISRYQTLITEQYLQN